MRPTSNIDRIRMYTLYFLLMLAGTPHLIPIAQYRNLPVCDHTRDVMQEYWYNDAFVCAAFTDI